MYVSYEDGDTEKMLGSEFNNIHQSMGRETERERERERGRSTLFVKPYLTAPHEQNIPLSLKETAMVCILWLQSYM